MVYDLFLDVFKYAISGTYYEKAIPQECIEEMLRLATDHKVLPMILDCLSYNPGIPKEQLNKYKLLIKSSIFSQAIITEKHLQVYKAISNKNIFPIVVKGFICKNLYPKPELRISSDEDWVLADSDAQICENIINSIGLNPSETNLQSNYENTYVNNSGLRIDLHKSFFPTENKFYDSWNKIFDDFDNKSVFVECNGVKIKTLCPTYQLIYLILHALKHFLHSGVGIRQIGDIGLYAKYYYKEIQWETLISQLKRIKADKFAFAVFEICRNNLGIFDFIISPEFIDAEPLLSDVLKAGIYGSSSQELCHSSTITISAAEKNKYGMVKWIFPSAERMSLKYRYVNKTVFLLPVAWIHRFFDYLKEVRNTRNNNPFTSIKIGKERTKLLKKYGIL